MSCCFITLSAAISAVTRVVLSYVAVSMILHVYVCMFALYNEIQRGQEEQEESKVIQILFHYGAGARKQKTKNKKIYIYIYIT